MVFTSGTTGEPKGVMHTPNTTLSTVYRLIERLEFSDRDIVLMASTLAHQTGYLYGHCLSMLLGATAVWMDVWQAEAAARLVAAEGVTFSMGATPFLRDLTTRRVRAPCAPSACSSRRERRSRARWSGMPRHGSVVRSRRAGA